MSPRTDPNEPPVASIVGSLRGTATLEEREPVGGGLQRIRLRVEPSLAATHARHGQYVEVREASGEEKGYFVIASAPGEETWDLVVRDSGAVSERLHVLPLGAEVSISEALGGGFPVEEARGRPLLLAVTGSAIAAVLSTIGARIDDRDARRTFLLYGVRDRGEVALQSELSAMRAAGVDVAICLSREHVGEPGFYKGYVQHVAAERAWDLVGGLAFVAGNEAMVEAMQKAAPNLGLPASALRSNT